MSKQNNDKFGSWSDLVKGLVGSYILKMGAEIGERVQEKVIKFERKSIGLFLILFGSIFLLIAVALLINALTKNNLPWLGWGVVGMVIILSGWVIGQKK